VPLSDHEQRMLDQIEKALYAEDPKFANSVRARDPRVHYRRRMIQAAIGFLLGVGLLLAGVVTKYIWMGVAGFLVMLTCSMWALTSWRHMNGTLPGRGPVAATTAPKRRGRAAGQGFMERLEERWRRRQERDG
jgi:Na+/proline symporter